MSSKSKALAFVLAALVFVGMAAFPSQYEVSLTGRDIQAVLDRQIGRELPVPGKVGYAIRTMRADRLEAHIADGRFVFSGTATGKLVSGDDFTLSATTTGMPRYADGEVFFDAQDARITDISYNRSAFKEKIIGLSGIFGDRTQDKVAKKMETIDKWENAAATRLLAYTLEKHPIYRLKDDVQGVMLRAALERVTIMNDHITFVFSIWRLTKTVIAALLMLAAVLLYLLLQLSDFLPRRRR